MQTLRFLQRRFRVLKSSLSLLPLALVAVLSAVLAIALVGASAMVLISAGVALFATAMLARHLHEHRLAAIRVQSAQRRRRR